MVFKTLPSFPEGTNCQLCLTQIIDPDELGNICQTADVIVHYFCLLLASKIQQKGTDKQGLLGFFSRDIKKEIKRGSNITCYYCKKTGATVTCSDETCDLNFHVPCAQENGSLHQYFCEFKSFCSKHKPRQKFPTSLKRRRDLECILCVDPVIQKGRKDKKDQVDKKKNAVIWPTCCKPKTLIHKRCLQQFATKSGYYFKCPFCSNKAEFCTGMKTFGIYIPEQEASWETEPDAYRELVDSNVKCAAEQCQCPRGADYSIRNSKWYLEICTICGASGLHRGCFPEHVNIETGAFQCDICAAILVALKTKQEDERKKPESTFVVAENHTKEKTDESTNHSPRGNISKHASSACNEIVVISDTESEEVNIEDVSEGSRATKNSRKRQLLKPQEKWLGQKRQRCF